MLAVSELAQLTMQLTVEESADSVRTGGAVNSGRVLVSFTTWL